MGGVVTAHTRDRAVSGPALVPEELLAKRDLFGCEWIVARNVCGVLLEAQWQHHLVVGALAGGGKDQDRRQHEHGQHSPDNAPPLRFLEAKETWPPVAEDSPRSRRLPGRRPSWRVRGRPRSPSLRQRAPAGCACLRWGRRPYSRRTASSRQQSPDPVAEAP